MTPEYEGTTVSAGEYIRSSCLHAHGWAVLEGIYLYYVHSHRDNTTGWTLPVSLTDNKQTVPDPVVVVVVVVAWFFIFTFCFVVFWLVKSCSLVCWSCHFRAKHYCCLFNTDAVSHISHSYPKKPKCEFSLLLKQKLLYL